MSEPQESLHFLDYWRIIRSRKEIVIAVALLVVITGIVITYALPKIYMASTLVQVRENTPDVEVFNRKMMPYDPLFLRTQFELIQSGPVVEEVVERLGLTEKLGTAYGYLDVLGPQRSVDQTLKIVSKAMRVQQYRDTNLIEIQVYLSEPKETVMATAADVANMVASVYRDIGLRRGREPIERALEALLASLDEQKQRVDAAEEKVESIRQKYGIAIVNTSPFGETAGGALAKVSMANLEEERIRQMQEVEAKRALLNKVMSMSEEELQAAGPHLVGDVALATLMADKRRAEVQRSGLLRASLGPKHPDVVSVNAAIEALEAMLRDAVLGLKTGVQADFEAAKARFDAITKYIDEMKVQDITDEATGYREFDKALEELQHARRIHDALEMRYLQERIELRIPRSTVQIVEPSTPPDEDDPTSPNYLLNIILSVLIGLASGVALAYFIEYLDTSVKTIEDIETFTGLPVLGVIPQKVKPFVDESAETAHHEAYRVLRTNIQFSKRLQGGRAICVTSGSVGEGKSLTIFNLAYTYAQLGDKILIVDSDLHRPRQHKMLAASRSIGLANVLVGERELSEAILHTQVPNLDLLTSGRLSSSIHGLLDTRRMKDLVKELKEQYSFVFFDAPPMIGVSDASLLVREMDGVLLVIQHRKYPRSVSSRAKDMVENVGGNLIGVVLNNINVSRDYSYYYYHQHYYSYPRRTETPAQT